MMSMETEEEEHRFGKKDISPVRHRKSVYKITTYRLPYMTMPKKTLDKIFYYLFGFIMLLSML
jgi:hypothetical protein